MMLYHLSDICRSVRIALRENVRTQPLLDAGDIDTLMLDEVIEAQVEKAACEVLLAAPHALLEEGLPFPAKVVWHRQPCHLWGHVLLPDDYLRLVSFRMSDWERAATLITVDDPRYQWQHSRFPGICGNPQNPIAVEVTYPEGRVLEFFSCHLPASLPKDVDKEPIFDIPPHDIHPSSVHPHVIYPHVIHARYLPIPRLHPVDRTIHLPRRLYDTLIERITLNVEH